MSSNMMRLLREPFGDGKDAAYARKPWIFCKACGRNTWRKGKAQGVGGHGWAFCSLACQKGKKAA